MSIQPINNISSSHRVLEPIREIDLTLEAAKLAQTYNDTIQPSIVGEESHLGKQLDITA